ncbi:hypothetical protein PC119_g26288 [Phytophthora cactorum]|nr:hypothetical protein PC119_g26288 [Phytophthora cactorum]KAG2972527.1 hypothetical protein PC120_g26289 [Phytophthora cactorum]KAG3123583.1 hypothetical protein C6341_g26497 [Phytophthora cactorum]
MHLTHQDKQPPWLVGGLHEVNGVYVWFDARVAQW